MTKERLKLFRRFWTKVDFTNLTGCWLWKAHCDPNGYGKFGIKRHIYYAHRVCYYFTNGNFDESLHVCHTCDTPTCVNPEHLFLGTAKDNSTDKIRKGRYFTGDHKQQLTLNPEQIAEIRRRYANGSTQDGLALVFGVSQCLIFNVIRRREHYVNT